MLVASNHRVPGRVLDLRWPYRGAAELARGKIAIETSVTLEQHNDQFALELLNGSRAEAVACERS